MRRGQTSATLLHRRPRRGQAAAPLALSGDGFKSLGLGADALLDSQGQGLTAITPAAIRSRAACEDHAAFPLVVVHHAALHAAGDRDDLAGDMSGDRR